MLCLIVKYHLILELNVFYSKLTTSITADYYSKSAKSCDTYVIFIVYFLSHPPNPVFSLNFFLLENTSLLGQFTAKISNLIKSGHPLRSLLTCFSTHKCIPKSSTRRCMLSYVNCKQLFTSSSFSCCQEINNLFLTGVMFHCKIEIEYRVKN